MIKLLGVAGAATIAALVSLPGLAQTMLTPGEQRVQEASTTPETDPNAPTVTPYTDPGMTNQPTIQEMTPEEMRQPGISRYDRNDNAVDENVGPSAVEGQGIPGPSETPSGSPSVPGVSVYDDPNEVPAQGAFNAPEMQDNAPEMQDAQNGVGGPSAVPTESFPGPSESPSGSPSVPGTSVYDDPNQNQPSQDARNNSDRLDPNRPEMQRMDSGTERMDGPSAVPGEGVPGPSESPSGSPSVPGTSEYDDPGMTPGS